MLFSYPQATQQALPKTATQFVKATQLVRSPEGMIITREFFDQYIDETHLKVELTKLIEAITDAASQTRVDQEIRRRVLTGKIHGDPASTIQEIAEVLGMHKTDLSVAEVPLNLVLYSDHQLDQQAVVLNVSGTKGLADAIRLLFVKLLVSPHPELDTNTAIAVYRMPPAAKTVRAHFREDQIVLEAVHGWGMLVDQDTETDRFILKSDGLQILQRHIADQSKAVVRNPRTGEIVMSTPPGGSQQKITDEQIRNIGRALKKSELSEAVFGVKDDNVWLLSAIPTDDAPVAAPVSQPQPQSFAPEPELEIVDLNEDLGIEIADENIDEPDDEEAGADEDFELDDTLTDDRDEEEPEEDSDSYDEEDDSEYDEKEDEDDSEYQDADDVEDGDELGESDDDYEDSDEDADDEDFDGEIEHVLDEIEHEDRAGVPEEPAEVIEVTENLEDESEYEDDSDSPEDDELDDDDYDDSDEDADDSEDEDADDDDDQPSNADESFEETVAYASAAAKQAVTTIEMMLREALDDDGPDEFTELVDLVARSRMVPYKQRLLTLAEMEESEQLEEPDAETVRFVLETLERFKREF